MSEIIIFQWYSVSNIWASSECFVTQNVLDNQSMWLKKKTQPEFNFAVNIYSPLKELEIPAAHAFLKHFFLILLLLIFHNLTHSVQPTIWHNSPNGQNDKKFSSTSFLCCDSFPSISRCHIQRILFNNEKMTLEWRSWPGEISMRNFQRFDLWCGISAFFFFLNWRHLLQ